MPDWSGWPCPDCKHRVSEHDMYGCTLRVCGGKWGTKPCELSGEFLIEFFNEGLENNKRLTQQKEKK